MSSVGSSTEGAVGSAVGSSVGCGSSVGATVGAGGSVGLIVGGGLVLETLTVVGGRAGELVGRTFWFRPSVAAAEGGGGQSLRT